MRTAHANYTPVDTRADSLAHALQFRRIPAGGYNDTEHRIALLGLLHRWGFSGSRINGVSAFTAYGRKMKLADAKRECAILERRAAADTAAQPEAAP